jgi:predicted transport protein
MQELRYIKPEKIFLKNHPQFNEKWLQDRIADDPSILGLGDLILKDVERVQPRAGRLDLLLQDSDANTRYEVEIQLGSTDESHIIRTIEYWDLERKRYPQYDHVAVIAAEDITSRFLNVISLFNGVIPLMAVQISAVRIGEQIALVCTTVLDQRILGIIEEEEEEETVDRSYWERRGTKETVQMVDKLLDIIRTIDPEFELKYNKFYIGLARTGRTFNFVSFKPQKNALRIEPYLKKSEELEKRLEAEGFDVMEYIARTGRYRMRLTKDDIDDHADTLKAIFEQAYKEFGD